MIIKKMTDEDFDVWVDLAKEVGPCFRAPNMHEDSEFIEYAKRKIEQGNALKAVDKKNTIMGIIGFSTAYNRITWFGVFEFYRNSGIGLALLETAIKELDRTKNITVETYPEDYAPGKPARALYFKAGFYFFGEKSLDPLGNPIVKLELVPPTNN